MTHQDKEFHLLSRKILGEPVTPSTVKFLLKHHWLKTERQAAVVLAAFIIGCFTLSGYILYRTYHQSNTVIFPDGTTMTIDQYIQGLKNGTYR